MIEIDPTKLLLRPVDVVLRFPDGSKRTVAVEGSGLFSDPATIVDDVSSLFAVAARRLVSEEGLSGTNFFPVSWNTLEALDYDADVVGRNGELSSLHDIRATNEVEAAAAAAFRLATAMLEEEPRFQVSSRGSLPNLPVALRSVIDTRAIFAHRSIFRPAMLETMCSSLERQGLIVSAADRTVVDLIRRHATIRAAFVKPGDHRSQGFVSPCVVNFRSPWAFRNEDGDDEREAHDVVVEMPAPGDDLGAWARRAAAAAGLGDGRNWSLVSVTPYGPKTRSTATVYGVDAAGGVRRLSLVVLATDLDDARCIAAVAAARASIPVDDDGGEPHGEALFEAMSSVPSSLSISVEQDFATDYLVNLASSLNHYGRQEERPNSVVQAFVGRLVAQLAWLDPIHVPAAFQASKTRDGFRHASLSPVVTDDPAIDMDVSAQMFGTGEPVSAPGF